MLVFRRGNVNSPVEPYVLYPWTFQGKTLPRVSREMFPLQLASCLVTTPERALADMCGASVKWKSGIAGLDQGLFFLGCLGGAIWDCTHCSMLPCESPLSAKTETVRCMTATVCLVCIFSFFGSMLCCHAIRVLVLFIILFCQVFLFCYSSLILNMWSVDFVYMAVELFVLTSQPNLLKRVSGTFFYSTALVLMKHVSKVEVGVVSHYQTGVF